MPRLGFFGKLPARGDFLTRALPPDALSVWEKWLEASMAGAKQQLGPRWGQVYERAPVWRFWVGGRLLGLPLTGVLAPSVDRVGRQFPLTFVLTGTPDTLPAAPLAGEGNTEWYERLDAAALEARHPRFDGDLDGLLERLPLPQGPRQAIADDQRAAFFAYGEAGLAQLVEDVRHHDHQLVANGRSYWWTAGNDFTGPAMVALNGMPDPRGFAALLQGFGPPVRVAPPAPVMDAAPEWDAVDSPATQPPLAEEQTTDMGWTATIPPTEVAAEDRERARTAGAMPPPVAPEAQDASPFDAQGNILRGQADDDLSADAEHVPESDPWAIATAPVTDMRADVPDMVQDAPPTPDTSPVSDPWKANDEADGEGTGPDLVREAAAVEAEPAAIHPEQGEGDTSPDDPPPADAVAQNLTDPVQASADGPDRAGPPPPEPEEETTVRPLDPTKVRASADDAIGEDMAVEDTVAAPLIAAGKQPHEEEEDSPFGAPQGTPAPRRKSLRGLFTRRGSE